MIQAGRKVIIIYDKAPIEIFKIKAGTMRTQGGESRLTLIEKSKP
jgi:hypothetical protein